MARLFRLEHPAREARGEDGPDRSAGVPLVVHGLDPPARGGGDRGDLRRGPGPVLPHAPEDFPPGSLNPPTDAAFFHPHAPIVSFLTAPMYLFDEADTVEMIHEPSLVPLSRATVRIVEAMRDQTAAGLRAARYTPPRSEPLPPCPPAT